MTPEYESYIPPEVQAESEEGKEKIKDGIWRPGILDAHAEHVAAAASTKLLRRTEDVALRILGDAQRFNRPLKDRMRAGRILAELRNEINPDADLHHIVKSQLVHSGEVKKIDEEFVEGLVKGNLDKKQIPKTDGLITNLKDVPLYVSAADCTPVGVYDPENQAIGVFHNGSAGLLNRISENGIDAMAREYGSKPENLVVTLAPGISQEGYPVERWVIDKMREKFGEEAMRFTKPGDKPDTYFFDVQAAIVWRLQEAGVKPENIEVSQYHTDTDNRLFSSERVEGNKDRDSYGFMIVLK